MQTFNFEIVDPINEQTFENKIIAVEKLKITSETTQAHHQKNAAKKSAHCELKSLAKTSLLVTIMVSICSAILWLGATWFTIETPIPTLPYLPTPVGFTNNEQQPIYNITKYQSLTDNNNRVQVIEQIVNPRVAKISVEKCNKPISGLSIDFSTKDISVNCRFAFGFLSLNRWTQSLPQGVIRRSCPTSQQIASVTIDEKSKDFDVICSKIPNNVEHIRGVAVINFDNNHTSIVPITHRPIVTKAKPKKSTKTSETKE